VNASVADLEVGSDGSETAAPAWAKRPEDRLNVRSSLAFFALHLLPFLAIFTGVTLTALILAFVTFTVRMFCITGGYHRYFSHKSYRLARVPQFVLAFGGTMASQKGPLWWAAHHRNHHRFSDTERDIHSPKRGFWWSHVGWILCDAYNESDRNQIRDFAKYPEIRFIDKHDWIGPWTLGALCFLIGGWSGLLIGFFASTVVLWHVTFTVNSVAHVFGRRAYETTDTSRNTLLIALATGGEGWHNNHHAHPTSARHGLAWYEFDPSWLLVKALRFFGVAKAVHVASVDSATADREEAA
jgi:stearoyl-CoA desaturase (Delta-9 desaturase)